MRPPLLAATVLVSLHVLIQPDLRAQEDGEGLFAKIQTSLGVLRARLDFEKAPLTVSNFVGLAEGTQKALDMRRGLVLQSGFYTGVPFQRPGNHALIESGLLYGDPEAGPGYDLRPEFHPDLNHDAPYRLSMVKAGANQNRHGSAFAITLAPAPERDGVHVVFGEIVEGREVVDAIAAAEPDTESHPNLPVTIEAITIERIGMAGEAFQPDPSLLPAVGFAPTRWAAGPAPALAIDYQPHSDYRLLTSPDLLTWSHEFLASFGETVSTGTHDLSTAVQQAPQGFFKVAETRYPEVSYPPAGLGGKRLDAVITQWDNTPTRSTVTYSFRNATEGAVTIGGETGTFRNYFYGVDGPTRATLVMQPMLTPALSAFSFSQFALSFSSETGGIFTANLLQSTWPQVTLIAGEFLLHDDE